MKETEIILRRSKDSNVQAVRFDRPETALSLAVTMTLAIPVFARQRFGNWARVLVGQINRGDYVFALDGQDPVGFCGWTPALKVDAEKWLKQDIEIAAMSPGQADCMIVNVVIAKTPAARTCLRDAVLSATDELHYVFAKRIAADGAKRLVRLKKPQSRVRQ